jgi:predicted lipid-binding transport protein (Tim44 family)
MKKWMLILVLALTSLMLFSSAEAKRLGGGGSFGKQSSNYARQAPSSPSGVTPVKPAAPAAAPQPTPQPTAPVRPASPWKGILGGALLGLGLGALFSHFGLGGAFGGLFCTILMIVLLVVVVRLLFGLFNRGTQRAESYPATYPATNSTNYANYTDDNRLSASSSATPEIGLGLHPVTSHQSGNETIVQWGIPADFDVPGFVRNAKSYFIRLQAAWDKADINDIREFTTPEMFGELRLQIQERGATPNNTDVVQIDAELLGIETLANDYLATVRFTGLIKEAQDAPSEPFVEIWNLSKPFDGAHGWVLAGIQQA